MADLKPCPFCGSLASVHTEGTGYHVRCNYERNCVAIGPWKKTEIEAIEAWNKRTPASRDREVVELVAEWLAMRPDCGGADAPKEMWSAYDHASANISKNKDAILKGADDE